MEFMKKLANLVDVKSIVTISLVFVLCVITLKGMAVPELFSTALMLVLGFFFGKNFTSNQDPGTETKNKEDI